VLYYSAKLEKELSAEYSTKSFKRDESQQKWYVVDASGKTLGRLAAKVAGILRGKNNPKFTTNSDMGDFVVVVNAGKVKVTGKKAGERKSIFITRISGRCDIYQV